MNQKLNKEISKAIGRSTVETIDEKLYRTAHEYYGNNKKRISDFILGAVFYRKFAVAEINNILLEIKGEMKTG